MSLHTFTRVSLFHAGRQYEPPLVVGDQAQAMTSPQATATVPGENAPQVVVTEEGPQVATEEGPEVELANGIEPTAPNPQQVDAEERLETTTSVHKAGFWSSRKLLVGAIAFLLLAIVAIGGGVGGAMASRKNKNAAQTSIPKSTVASPSSATQTPLPQNASYQLGCFYDDRALALREGKHVDPGMTPQLCGTFCKDFLFYGVENGNNCFCGKVLHDEYPRAQQSDCDQDCAGNSSLTCGGVSRVQVYTTSSTETGPPQLNYTLKGCYEDQWARGLPDLFKQDSRMTPMLCAGFCQDYKYMGLEYSTQCMCGYTWPGIYPKVPDSDCNATCGGDLTKICGATWRLSLYSLG